MTKRIFSSICLVALVVFLASTVLIMGVLYGYFSDIQRAQLDMQLELAAQGAQREGKDFFGGIETKNYRITWIAPQGEVLFDSHSAGTENHLEREEIKEALATGHGTSRRYSSTLMERSFYTAQRLEDGSVLRLSMAQHSALTLLLGMAQPICIVFLVAVGLSVFFAVRLSRHIVRPLTRLDPDHPLEGGRYEELKPLLGRIHSQQRQLKRQKEALEQKQAELDQAEQARREFTANVSHELKTPLQSICGYAELLQNGMVKPEDTVPFTARIYREAKRMVGLVEDIISLSHLDEGAKDMDWRRVDLYETAAQAIHSLAPQADQAGIALKLGGGPAPLYGIPQLLYSIVYNLCDNAIKYNHPEGSVQIAVQAAEERVILTVSDTGIGIPDEEQERIFQRFYRVDKSRSRAVGGTGLGLSIVKHAVLVHHGEITLESCQEQGTTVTVWLPNKGIENAAG